MQASLSVILCTHNPRPDYLRRAIDSLRRQTLPVGAWELLLIDNASEGRLADIWDLSWHPRARHVREDELGLTAARLRGIADSSGELLVFVDDDNVLAEDYLELAAAVPALHPHLGVFGAGTLEPEFEIQPPPELAPRLSILALRSVPTPLWTNNARDHGAIPWGAGLAVTRRIANLYLRLLREVDIRGVVGRRGQHLFSGEDDVFSWTAAAAGLGFGLFPQLRITHLISARRLNRSYFLKLIHDKAFSHGVLDHLLADSKPPRIDAFRLARLVLHAIRNGHFSMRCQWAATRGGAAAARFVTENRLQPIRMAAVLEPSGSGDGEVGLRAPDGTTRRAARDGR